MVMQLVEPDKKYLPSVYEAIAEYKSAPSKYEIHAVGKIIAASNDGFKDYFKNVENGAKGINLKPGYVAYTTFWLVDGDKYIGSFDLRHSLTPALKQIGGHIAYQIRPSAQRKGYASHGLALCLAKAKEMGITQVLITCNADNSASFGVMHKAMSKFGGFEDSPYKSADLVEQRIWINTL